jgi:uncharacterized protein involved in exopolysaccharide biosynthesis
MTDPEQNPEGQRTLRDFLAALSRRRKPVVATAVLCVLITLLLALLLPARYQSTGTILIEQQEVPQDLVRSTVSSYADQRVQTISQRVMTTQNLLDIIRRYDLYPSERKRESREEIIERMRHDIAFKMISADVVDPRTGVPRQATIAFTISYTSRSPDQAVKVANELVTLYLNENLTERTRLAEDASGFLKGEADGLSSHIADLEAKLAEFKSRHVDALPEHTQLNMQLLDRTEQELRETQTRQMSLEQQRSYLEAQLAQIKPNSVLVGQDGERILTPSDRLKMLQTELASAEAVYAPTHPDVIRLKREIAGLKEQQGASAPTNDLLRELDEARGELAAARKRYSPQHPDVQRLEKRVAALEAALVPENASPVAPGSATRLAVDNPDNPAYIQLKAQLSGVLNDLQALQAQDRELRARVADYQRKILLSPEVEKEYRELARDLESAQLKYQEVRSKQMEAQFAQNLEINRKGERFTLIEPPLPPEEPVSPNRPAILVLGLILSLALGAGVAALLESVDATVRGRRDVVELLQAAPLAIVPRITTTSDVRAAKRRARLTVCTTAAACVMTILAVHFFYRPLDVLWFAAIRHLGM